LIVLEHDLQNKLLNEIITLKLNSRSVETKVKELSGKIQIDEETLHLQKALEDLIGTKVDVKKNAKGFKVNINFSDKESLSSFLENLGSN
jgi:hypothetical protein